MSYTLPEFICVPSVIIRDKEMTDLDGHLYGVLYWYTKQKLEKCIRDYSAWKTGARGWPVKTRSKAVSRCCPCLRIVEM